MKEDDKLRNDLIIEKSLNLYVIAKLYKENLINEKEYYYLKEIIQNIKYTTTDSIKNVI